MDTSPAQHSEDLQRYVEVLRSTLQQAGIEPPPFLPTLAATDEPDLTDREREVLGLLAIGLSNRQIADRMYLSVDTVKTHARGVYRKLGFHSRNEAIRWCLTRAAPAASEMEDPAAAPVA